MSYYRLPCISLGLFFIYTQTSFSRGCDVTFTDVPSRTYKADSIFVARAHRVPSVNKNSKEVVARFKVDDVLKGTLEKEPDSGRYPTIIVGMFRRRPAPESCLAPMPHVGSRYVLFLRSTENITAFRRSRKVDSVPLNAFLISSLPLPYSDAVVADVLNSTRTKVRKPRVKLQSKSDVYTAGQTARLQCVASGRPRPKVVWFKDGATLSNTSRLALYSTKRGSALTIWRMSQTDAGTYQCQAINVAGRSSLKSANSTLKLSVVSASTSPSQTEPSPMTTTSPNDHKKSCDPQHSDYCFNGGTCFTIPALSETELRCQCPIGHVGGRCQEKDPGIKARLVVGRERKKRILLRALFM